MGNLKNKVISSNFQKLLQISSSNEVADGTGSATPLSIDKANSRIGIGVKNPKLPVDIVGTLNISGSELFPTSGSAEEEFNPEIVAIISTGSIVPHTPDGATTGSYDLGSATNPWRDLYLYSGSLKIVNNGRVISLTGQDLEELKSGQLPSTRLSGSAKPGVVDAGLIRALAAGTTLDSDTRILMNTANQIKMEAGGEEFLKFQQDNAFDASHVPTLFLGVNTGSAEYQTSILSHASASRDFYVSGSQNVIGNLIVRGDAEVRGNLTFGNEDTDSVSFGADISSSINPDVSGLYDLGNTSKRWRNLSAQFIGIDGSIEQIDVGTIRLTNSTIKPTTDGGNITLSPVGSSTVVIGHENFESNFLDRLTVHGNISSSNKLIGTELVLNSPLDNYGFSLPEARILGPGSDLKPTDIFVIRQGNISLNSGNLTISGTLSVPGISDVSASLAAAVSGSDNLGNHTATQNLNLKGNNIISASNISSSGNLEVNTIIMSASAGQSSSISFNSGFQSYKINATDDNFELSDSTNNNTIFFSEPNATGEIGIGTKLLSNKAGFKLTVGGAVTASKGTFGGILQSKNQLITGSIDATGNITALGDLQINDITASGNITASGTITASSMLAKTFTVSTGGTFNDSGGASTFLVKGNNDATLFNANVGGQDKIGVGGFAAAAGSKVQITGDLSITSHITSSGEISASSTGSFSELNIGGGKFTSASFAAAAAGADNLGNHTATQNLSLGDFNIIDVLGISASGNISGSSVSASNGFHGNLTGNATTATLASGLDGTPSINVTNITASGNISASGTSHKFGGTVTATSLEGTLTTAAQSNVTSLGTLSTLTVGGQISASGDIKNNFGTIISSSGDVYLEGSFYQSNIKRLSLGSINEFLGDISSSGDLYVGGFDIYGGTVKRLSLGSTNLFFGDVSASGNFSTNGNITSSNILAKGNINIGDDIENPNVVIDRTGHITASGDISASGQITASSFKGDGSGLTNVTATLPSGVYSSSLQTLSHITSSGNISASGDIFADELRLTGDIIYSDGVARLTLGSTSVFNSNISSSGNIKNNAGIILSSSGNIVTNGNISASGGTITAQGVSAGTLEAIITTDATDASGDTGVLKIEGGASIAKKVFAGTFVSSSQLRSANDVVVGSHITASGDISSSGTITGGGLDINGTTDMIGLNLTSHLTSSANISSSNSSTGSFGSMILNNLPTNPPTRSGSLWLSGSAGAGSKFLVVFTGE